MHALAAIVALLQTIDHAGWSSELAALEAGLEAHYAHLPWFASPEGGVDLPALHRQATAALDRATTDEEAKAALTAFVSGFRDPHLAPTRLPAPAGAPADPPWPEPNDAKTACAAFGYAPSSQVQLSLPIESLPGFTLVADGLVDPFRAGVIATRAGRLGVIRIPRFRPTDSAPVCERAWATLAARGVARSREAVATEAHHEWLATLATRLTQLRDRDVAALIVDVGLDGGGDDLGDWAVRLFTSADVPSAPMWVQAGPAGDPYFRTQRDALREADRSPALDTTSRAELAGGVAAFEALLARSGATQCDLSWVWRERRPWRSQGCTGLLDAGFASGYKAFAASGALSRPAAAALYWASAADFARGTWAGPTYVLVDGVTGSAAEMFAALMRDRAGARIVGSRTRGAGCGFADVDAPLVLPRARLAFSVPNCVRLRADGTDDVAGVRPDLPLVAGPGESPRALAARALQVIADDLTAAPRSPP